MIEDTLVLRVERLRDAVVQFRSELRHRYHTTNRPVVAVELKKLAAQLGEKWVVEIAPRDDVRQVLGEDIVGDLNIDFQRLITYSEQSSQRSRYETSIKNILRDFHNRVVIPLKKARNASIGTPEVPTLKNPSTSVFIAQSFSPRDTVVNLAVFRLVEAWGFTIVTGEKPKADSVSKKVRERIEAASLFLGIFTRRDQIKGRKEWTTSPWVIDEKAYAFAKGKKLILLRESEVQSIGGIQGDYEYIEFSREDLVDLVIKLLLLLRSFS